MAERVLSPSSGPVPAPVNDQYSHQQLSAAAADNNNPAAPADYYQQQQQSSSRPTDRRRSRSRSPIVPVPPPHFQQRQFDRPPRDMSRKGPQGSETDYTNLYVSNLSFEYSKEDLQLLCSSHHKEPVDCRIVYNQTLGRSRGFAFINCSNPADAESIRLAIDGRQLSNDRPPISVVFASKPPSNSTWHNRSVENAPAPGASLSNNNNNNDRPQYNNNNNNNNDYNNNPSISNNQGQVPCRTYSRTGSCSYADRCKYLHDPRTIVTDRDRDSRDSRDRDRDRDRDSRSDRDRDRDRDRPRYRDEFQDNRYSAPLPPPIDNRDPYNRDYYAPPASASASAASVPPVSRDQYRDRDYRDRDRDRLDPRDRERDYRDPYSSRDSYPPASVPAPYNSRDPAAVPISAAQYRDNRYDPYYQSQPQTTNAAAAHYMRPPPIDPYSSQQSAQSLPPPPSHMQQPPYQQPYDEYPPVSAPIPRY